MTIRDIFVSVILPCRNTGSDIVDRIGEIHRILQQICTYSEIVVVDDGSDEGTIDALSGILTKYEGIRVVRLAQAHGMEVAMMAGLDTAIGDYVVIMDPATDPVDMLPELVERCRISGGILYGIPKGMRKRPVLRECASRGFAWYCAKFLNMDIQRNASTFRIFSRQSANAISKLHDRTQQVRLISAMSGFPIEAFDYEVSSAQPSRLTQSGLFDDIDRAFEMLTTVSRHPLRWLSRLGVLAAFINVVYALYVFAIFFFKRNVAEGWVTTSLQNAGMFFLLFLILSVLCEYVGKLMSDLRQQAPYTVLEEQTSSILVDASRRRNIVSKPTE